MDLGIFDRSLINSRLSLLAPFLAAVLGSACSAGHGDSSEEPNAELGALECDEGACPLLVDPAAARDGDGSSWASPLRSVQGAIDTQGARGGGEVWVRAGAFEALTGSPEETLLVLHAGVRLLGGFAGAEGSAEDRDPASRTLIAGAPWGDDDESPPLITGESRSALDGFSIVGQHGPVLVIREASDVRVTNVSIEDSWVYDGGLIDLADSEARFEGLHVTDSETQEGVAGVLAERSRVRLASSEFVRSKISVSGAAAAVAASSSTLVLDDVRFIGNSASPLGQASALAVTDSEVLIVDSTWLQNAGDRGALVATDSRLVAVNSHWENNGGTVGVARILSGTEALFLNASFIDNTTSHQGTVAAENSALEIVNTTFVDNRCVYPGHQYPDDVSLSGSGQVAYFNSYSNRGQYSVYSPFTGSGNCLVEGAEPYRFSEGELTHAQLRPEFGCTNAGNDLRVREATERASEFAISLGEAGPIGPESWRTSSSVFDVAADTAQIDPGRHYRSNQ